MVIAGLLHAKLASQTGACFVPERPGDRAVYDFVMSHGEERPGVRQVEPLVIPSFSQALWPDLAAVRRDSEAVASIRTALTSAVSLPSDQAPQYLAEQLEEAAARARRDTSLLRVARGGLQELAVGTFSGAASSALTEDMRTAVFAGLVGAGATYLMNIYRKAFSPEAGKAYRRSEIILRIAERLRGPQEP